MNTTTPTVSSLPTRDILLNSSSLKLSHCPARWHNRVIRGLVSKEIREELIFGKAVHKYAEQRTRGADFTGALGQAVNIYNGIEPDKLVMTCTQMPPTMVAPYVDHDGRPYLELKFKVFWKSIVYNDIQYNIYICGTFDVVSLLSDGSVRILDYKTSRKWKFDEVFYGYRVSVQMIFYAWAAFKFGNSIFNLTVANATTRGNVFVQICGVFISAKPPVWKIGPPIQASIEELLEFEVLLQDQIDNTLLHACEAPIMLGKVNDTCAQCEYTQICFADNDTARTQAESEFDVIPYDPASW